MQLSSRQHFCETFSVRCKIQFVNSAERGLHFCIKTYRVAHYVGCFRKVGTRYVLLLKFLDSSKTWTFKLEINAIKKVVLNVIRAKNTPFFVTHFCYRGWWTCFNGNDQVDTISWPKNGQQESDIFRFPLSLEHFFDLFQIYSWPYPCISRSFCFQSLRLLIENVSVFVLNS